MDELIIFQNICQKKSEKLKLILIGELKNVVAHLIAWNYEATREINRFSKEGGQPRYLNSERNYDDFNAKAVEKYMNLSKIELVAELSKSETEVREAIKKCGQEIDIEGILTPDKFQSAVRDLVSKSE